MITYGVFTKDKDFAIKLITYKIRRCKSVNIQSTPISYIANTDTGVIYRWVNPVDNNLRGIKVDIGIIDIDTCSLDMIQLIVNYCIIIEEQYDIITQSRNEPYDLDTLIDRLEKVKYIKGNLKTVKYYGDEYEEKVIHNLTILENSLFLE